MTMRLIFWLSLVLLTGFAPAVLAQPKLGTVQSQLNTTALNPGGQGVIAVVLTVPAAHHAQSHTPKGEDLIACVVKMVETPGIKFLEPVYPPGKDVTDPVLGALNVYEGDTAIYVPFTVAADAKLGDVELKGKITFQICNEEGTCFPPESPAVSVKTKIVDLNTPVSPANVATFKGFDPKVFAKAAGQPAQATTQPTTQPAAAAAAASPTFSFLGHQITLSSIWVVVPIAMLVGLIFNIMPCVLPVLPLKALGFYEASQHNRAKTLGFGLSFSLGLIVVFTTLALFVILSKSILGREFQWGQWFAIGWVVWTMGLVLIVLGMGMLDAFPINLPNSVYGLNFRHDTISGNFLWGAFTAILSTPCTAPMFAYLLGWAITQPVYLATIGMISVGVGMALPYLILSAFPELARRFPRTGPASELVKQSMAFLMFGTAAWLVGPRLVEQPNHYWLIVAVALWGSLFLIVRGATIFKSSGGVLVLSAIVVGMLGGSVLLALEMTGALESHASTNGSTDTKRERDLWAPYSDSAFASARKSGQPVLVKFTAAWCANCQVIERTVYTDANAVRTLKDDKVIMLKADLTLDDAPGWKLLNELGQTGIPLTAIYQPNAEKPQMLSSLYTAQTLLQTLKGG